MSKSHILRWSRQNLFSSVGIVLALLLMIICLFAPKLAPYDPTKQDYINTLQTPSSEHLLGTDHIGRDQLSRVLWAGQVSITTAVIVLFLSLTIGLVIGLLAGYVGGIVDDILMRIADIFLALPTIIMAMALIGTLGPGMGNLILALTIAWWPAYARLVRSKVLAIKSSDYVLVSENLGASNFHIMFKHLLPSLIGPVVVLLSLDVGSVILSVAGLGFLGLGIQPPKPEWGTMLVDSRPYMQLAPHLVLAPGLAILVTVFGFNSFGEGLDTLLNPKSDSC